MSLLTIIQALAASPVVVEPYREVAGLFSELTIAGGTNNTTHITLPGSGTLSVRASYNFQVMPAYCRFTAVIMPTTGTVKFGLGRHPGDLYGTIMTIDQAGQLLIGPWDGGNTAATPYFTLATGLSIVAGEEYTLEVTKRGKNFDVKITGNGGEYTYSNWTHYGYAGNWFGRPVIVCQTGSIDIISWKFEIENNPYPFAIFGDSFVGDGGDIPNAKYVQLLAENIGYDQLYISGKGGENTSQFVTNRMAKELSWITPDYVIIALGTNDTSSGTYQSNFTSMANAIIARGAVPIFVTITPRTDSSNTSFITVVNPWIRASGRRYIDINAACTTNGTTQTPGFFLVDGVHMNLTGHEAAYARLLTDLSDII